MQKLDKARKDLLEIYMAAVESVNGKQVVRDYLTCQKPTGPLSLVAVGKAAEAMAQGAEEVLGDQLLDGLIITKYGHLTPHWIGKSRFSGLESGHPVPDQGSLEAGRQLLEYLQAIPEEHQILFLISGGASSLVEVLNEGLQLEDLQRLNEWLLGSGLAIGRMNRIRKRISQIKGGGLLAFLANRRVTALLISDVQGDDPAVIGSGLLVRDETEELLPRDMPEWVRQMLTAETKPESGPSELKLEIVATLRVAREAAAEKARELGYQAKINHAFISADAANSGERLALELIDTQPGVYIWGGEPSVHLPADPGRGGRNQHLALSAATILEGYRDLCFLAAGTDGTDGPGEDAGALVDGHTIKRGRREEMDPDVCLASADSGSFLEASGDLITIGPTGTNVMDLMIGLKFD